MSNKQIVENFWLTMATNDFHAAAALLHDDYILEWPQSGERIRGRNNLQPSIRIIPPKEIGASSSIRSCQKEIWLSQMSPPQMER